MTFAGTLIGFDFGERRIGVAVAETGWTEARAIGVIHESTNDARFAAIDKLEREWRPVAFVVGQPRHADGAPHALAELASKFGRRLAARYRRPVVLVDETLTSVEAEAELRKGKRTRGAASTVDAVAARIILQSYLDDPEGREHVAPRS